MSILTGRARFALRNCAVCLWQTCGARECEGKNHREREVFAALRSPLSLRFSPSRSLSPYPLPSVALNLSAADSRGIGFRKAGDRGRKPKGKGECELCEYPPSTWVVTPVSWGEMTHRIKWSKLGEVMPANSDLFEFACIRKVCSRYTQHIRRALDQRLSHVCKKQTAQFRFAKRAAPPTLSHFYCRFV